VKKAKPACSFRLSVSRRLNPADELLYAANANSGLAFIVLPDYLRGQLASSARSPYLYLPGRNLSPPDIHYSTTEAGKVKL